MPLGSFAELQVIRRCVLINFIDSHLNAHSILVSPSRSVPHCTIRMQASQTRAGLPNACRPPKRMQASQTRLCVPTTARAHANSRLATSSQAVVNRVMARAVLGPCTPSPERVAAAATRQLALWNHLQRGVHQREGTYTGPPTCYDKYVLAPVLRDGNHRIQVAPPVASRPHATPAQL